MASCEKCWVDAYTRSLVQPWKSQSEHYQELMLERRDNPCTPKQQAGSYWDEENQRDTREDRNETI